MRVAKFRGKSLALHTMAAPAKRVAVKVSCPTERYDKGHVAALVRSHMNGLLFLPDGYVMLTRPNKVETAVHGCHCPGDTSVRMRKVLARPWVGVLVYHHSRPQSLLLACGRNRELWEQPF